MKFEWPFPNTPLLQMTAFSFSFVILMCEELFGLSNFLLSSCSLKAILSPLPKEN